MLRVIAFPANEGDCILVEYGDLAEPARILIDGGRLATYRNHLKAYLAAIPDAKRRLDLFVITHIDRDHIEGALALAEDESLRLKVGDVWFNSYQHLPSDTLNVLGAADGERLTVAIRDRRRWPWNKAFDGGPVSLGGATTAISKTLPQGAVLRLLSPDTRKLRALKPVWIAQCRTEGLIPGGLAGGTAPLRSNLTVLGPRTSVDLAKLAERDTPPDRAEPNGSSIAFMFEHDGRRLLFAADAHPDILLAALRLHYPVSRVQIDLFKVSHHGSRSNTTMNLCNSIEYSDVLISTNGSMFRHPDEEALARIIVCSRNRKNIFFNYGTAISRSWQNPLLFEKYNFGIVQPSQDDNGFCVLDFCADRSIRHSLQPHVT